MKRLNAGGGFLHRLCPPPGLAPCAGRQAHWPPERFIHNFKCPRQPCLVKPSLGGNWVRPSHTGLVYPVVGHEAWVLVAFWHDHCASAAHHPLSLHLTFLKRPAKAPSSSDEGWGAMNLTQGAAPSPSLVKQAGRRLGKNLCGAEQGQALRAPGSSSLRRVSCGPSAFTILASLAVPSD